MNETQLIAENLGTKMGMTRRSSKSWMNVLIVRTIILSMAIAVITPYEKLYACACSEVVVGQGIVSSNMQVDDRTGELTLIQSDISLPGVIPVDLTRVFKSNVTTPGIFGVGWCTDFVSYLVGDTTGDLEINFNGGIEKFKVSDSYFNETKSRKATISGTTPDEIVTVEDKYGEKWIFDVKDKTIKEYSDANGNKVTYTWETPVAFEFWGNDVIVYRPATITFPGSRAISFEYSTTEGMTHLCTEATSPSGFTIEYTYTDKLLTKIEKSNSQVLNYAYQTEVHPEDSTSIIGRLKKITYANAAEVNITYSVIGEGSSAMKVTRVTGPHGYDHQYSYTVTPVEGQDKPNVTAVLTDSLDHDTAYAYTNSEKTLKVTDALSNYTEDIKNSQFLTTSFRNRRGKTTTYTYDSSNSDVFAKSNRLTMTNPLNKTWTYAYDSNNFRTSVTDPLGHATRQVTYDSKGNVLTRKNGLNQTIQTNTYTTTGIKGLLETRKNGVNDETEFEYDSFGLLTKITDPAGKEWEYEYSADGAGNLTKFINPLGKEWEREYNGFYKASKIIDPLNHETELAYDDMANLTKVTDANENETEFTYDSLQRVTQITDALDHTIDFTYDAENNLTKLKDALNHEYTYTFDAINNTKTFKFPDNSQESYDYDANSNLTKLTRRDSKEITFSYDDADRRTSKTWEDTTDTVFSYSYDDANRLTGSTKVTGGTTDSSISYSYDNANHLTSTTAESRTTSYEYDNAERLKKITYPSSEVANYAYNSRSFLDTIKDGSNSTIVSYTYDDAGRLIKKTLANDLECIYEYNDANWVTKIALRETVTPANVRQSFEYGYDNVGNQLWVKYKNGSGDVYQYDATYQLTGVKYGVSNPADGYASATGASREVTYTYDAVGNRTQTTDTAASTTSYSVNNLNQYTQVGANTSFTYDDNGNLTGDGTWAYGYDRENHLISADKSGMSVTYKYDANGRRIEKSVNGALMKYVYSGANLIEERDGANNVIAKYIYEGGVDHPVKIIKGSNVYYFQQEKNGNVTALTDSSGNIYESYTYDVYGSPMIRDSSNNIITTSATSLLFTGREFDSETGLYHYRSRTYSPHLGKFLQVDTISFGGGDVNLYRYVRNNPANYSDPNGTYAGGATAVAGGVSMGPVGAALTTAWAGYTIGDAIGHIPTGDDKNVHDRLADAIYEAFIKDPSSGLIKCTLTQQGEKDDCYGVVRCDYICEDGTTPYKFTLAGDCDKEYYK